MISGLLVTVLVVLVLVLTKSSEPEPRRPERPPAPSPLTEQEVRTYIAVGPQIYAVLAAAVPELAPGSEGVDRAELGRQIRAAVGVILENNHLTHESWNRLSRRVEHAVDVVRWRAEAQERNADLDARIQQKEALLRFAKGKARQPIEADIQALKDQRADEGPALLKRDVDLVRSFWSDLERIVPARGSPPKKQ